VSLPPPCSLPGRASFFLSSLAAALAISACSRGRRRRRPAPPPPEFDVSPGLVRPVRQWGQFRATYRRDRCGSMCAPRHGYQSTASRSRKRRVNAGDLCSWSIRAPYPCPTTSAGGSTAHAQRAPQNSLPERSNRAAKRLIASGPRHLARIIRHARPRRLDSERPMCWSRAAGDGETPLASLSALSPIAARQSLDA